MIDAQRRQAAHQPLNRPPTPPSRLNPRWNCEPGSRLIPRWTRLTLDDIDWERDILHVTRAKQRCKQDYPLSTEVGNAILRYLREVRTPCASRRLFLTLKAPLGPLAPNGLHHAVASPLQALGIRSPRRGPHALRHACAAHLLGQGLSLKEIGDHLGHRSPSATRTYAKVDLVGLREVAEFSLGHSRWSLHRRLNPAPSRLPGSGERGEPRAVKI